MLPLVCHEEFRSVCMASYAWRLKLVSILLSFYLLCLIGSIVVLGYSPSLAAALFICLTLAMQVNLDRCVYGSASHVMDRTRFFAWLLGNDTFLRAGIVCATMLFSLAAMQLLFQSRTGGFDPLFEHFGGLYRSIEAGEIWRLVTTSLMHASPVHFLSNAALLMVVAPFVFVFARWLAALAFLAGCVGGNLLQWQLAPQGDGLVGSSGGVFALYGAALAISILGRRQFPAGLAVQVAVLSTVSLVAASAFGSSVAHVTHGAGFVLGMALTFLVHGARAHR